MSELPTDKARRQGLSKLPSTLFATYDRILMRVEEYSDEVKQLVRKILLLLVDSLAISFRELCETISLHDDADSLEEEDIVSEEDVLRWCSSLVRTKEVLIRGCPTTEIEFAHFTVREYLDALDTKPIGLRNPHLKQYAITAETVHTFRTHVYLRFLTMDYIDRTIQAGCLAHVISDIVLERRTHETYRKGVCSLLLYMEKGMAVGGQNYQLAQKLLLLKTPLFCLWAVEFIFQLLSDQIEDRGELPNASTLIQLAVSTVLRTDFTTLHMAAVFYAPDICQELLQGGSSPDVCSNFGSPLHYAVSGWAIFLDMGHVSPLSLYPGRHASAKRRHRTVELLLSSGAKPNCEIQTPFSTITLISVPLERYVDPFLAIQVTLLLVSAHIDITVRDVLGFEEFYNNHFLLHDLEFPSDLLKDLHRLVEVLDDQTELSAPGFTLRQKTVDAISKSWKVTSEHPAMGVHDSAKAEEIQAHILSIISLNDRRGLDMFLATDHSRLIMSLGLDPKSLTDYTALHLAVSMRSLDLIEPLLAFGLDPQAKTRYGTTPMHLCDDRNSWKALSALLRYAGSSIDKDRWGKTIWHRAAEKGAVEIIEVLLSRAEADVALKMVSHTGQTPICVATPQVYALLMTYWERNGYFGSGEFYKYLATSEMLLRILRRPTNQDFLESFREHESFSGTTGGLRMLAECFKKAMEEQELGICEKLFSLGCPTEFNLEMGMNVTPFGLAVWRAQEKMVEWFLTKGTPVSTVFRHPSDAYNCTALDIVLERPHFNLYLPLLVERYLQEGGDFSHMPFSLLHNPINVPNQDGLLILLEALQGKDVGSGECM
ncbi:hypothetical protein NW768_006805 [Fusarium equiseti]|uniref:Ankyrin n=1 Tax=Fusarium equiseti TaxID=61235 RepID=A0ABQ8R997_FUSEQ|nr:hypothetical protein NW768_006805 [Fusarium equiseti]